MAQEQPKNSIWSLSGLGSAVGGLLFEDPPESDDEQTVLPPGKDSPPAIHADSNIRGPADGVAAKSSSSVSPQPTHEGGGGEGPITPTTQRGSVLGGVVGAVGMVVPTFGMLSPKKDFPLPTKVPRPRRKGDVPVAGQTCAEFKRESLTDEFHTWFPSDASKFELRVGPNYEKLKKKGASAEALYNIVGLDIYKTPHKIDNIGSKVQLPAEWTSVKTGHVGVPPVFIVQCQLPEVSIMSLPSFGEVTDGPGWSVTLYYRISEKTLAALKDLPSASGGIKLFVDYCKNAPEQDSNPKSPYRGRFKICPRVDNIEELSLPYIVSSYNCKPALVVKTGTVFRGENYIEMDVNVHNFGAAARTALQIIRFDIMTANWGLCIESREDDEMPEVLFGCVCLNRQMLSLADEWHH